MDGEFSGKEDVKTQTIKNMDLQEKTSIQVQTTIKAAVATVWKKWTTPSDIVKWNTASDDWHTTRVENDLRVGGKFLWRMEAKDGSMGFDFRGVYDEVQTKERIASTLDDDRKLTIVFRSISNATEVVETFEAENENPIEMQRKGWQAILDNFKKYVEEEL